MIKRTLLFLSAFAISSLVAQADIVKMLITELNGTPYPQSTEYTFDTATATYTNEDAQDAVGGILTDTASIDFSYNDAGNVINATVLPAGVDHGGLAGLGDDDHTQYMLVSNGTVVANAVAIWDVNANPGRQLRNSSVFINSDGDMAINGTVLASNFTGSSSGVNTGDVTLSAFGSSPNANGASLSGQALTLQPANGSNPGGVSTTTQTFAGNKTFSGTIAASNFSGTSSGTNTGDQTITLTGDVTGSGTGSFAATIANDAVTYAKMQNVSAATRLLGRGSASGAGDPEEITVSTGLSLSGTALSSTITQYTDELAQDAVGGALTDTASVDFTYNDGANTISAAVLPAGVDHNSLANLTSGDPHTQYTLDAGTTVDNELIRADGTDGRHQQSTGIIVDDLKNMTGGKSIKLGDVTWSDVNLFNSVSNMDFTSTGTMTFNTGGTANFNMISFGGDINAAAENNVVFASNTGDISMLSNGAGTFSTASGDLTLEATNNDIQLNAPSGGIFANTDLNMGGSLVMGANSLLFGTGNEAAMSYSSGLFINPKVSGASELTIGSAPGVNDADLLVNKVGLLGSAISSTAVVNLLATGSARQALNFNLTFTGVGNSNASIVATSRDQGSNGTFLNTNIISQYTLDTTSHTTVTSSGIYSQQGIAAAQAMSTGTYTFHALRGSASAFGTGGSHTGGTFRRYGLFLDNITALSGTPAADLIMGIWSPDSFNTDADTKIILDSTSTALGDSYEIYDSGTGETQLYNDGTLAMSWDADETRTEVKHGTKAGTSTAYAKVGGTLDVNSTAVGNVGGGEDDLISYTLPASALATNGDYITFEAAGTTAANANNKTLKVKFGATSILDTGASAFNGLSWNVKCKVVRTGAATQKGSCTWVGGTNQIRSNFTTPAETLSGTVVIKMTGESAASATDDIKEEFHTVEWSPVQ